MKVHNYIMFLLILSITTNCSLKRNEQLFQLRKVSQTGLTFNNKITVSDSMNAVTFEYIYNGGGAAVGDVNNDGLKDLFFSGNMVSSKLYLNVGELEFMDITEESGAITDSWCTGASFVDINADGLLDLYIAVAGLVKAELRRNLFFINEGIDENGIPHFANKAVEMGLDDDGYSTMGVFFDYDKDLDLDMYLLTNSMEGSQRNMIKPINKAGESPTTDRFYRNNGDGTFTNWSTEAGVQKEGYGLGVALCDINQDNWIDVYCANDFISSDLLWINNQDGTFTESASEYFKHFTSNGMGMDIADYNNDAMLDVVVLDMMPASNLRQKLMFAFRNMDRLHESIEAGYLPQFMRNTLQLNMGKFPDGKFHFSEISYLAGMYQTDWSWAPLMVDFDNDGWKDLLITNGYRKDVTNLDYINEIIRETKFGTNEENKLFLVQSVEKLSDVKLQNYIFKNNKDLTFRDKSEDWGLNSPSFTNGTIAADLDNDGDLDIVLNNIDQEVHLYENLLNERTEKEKHYLSIKFDGALSDSEKIGSKFWIFHDNNKQYFEYSPYRGYKSTITREIHVGLGNSNNVDSIIVQWPDGNVQREVNIEVNDIYSLSKSKPLLTRQKHYISHFNEISNQVIFKDITDSLNFDFKHVESNFNDFKRTPSLLRSLSKNGPSLSVGDVNNDGLDDFFVGGDRNKPPKIFLQNPNNSFTLSAMKLDSLSEDVGSLFFDADNDGDQDLYVVSGGSQWNDGHENYQDRLYINEGSNGFTLNKSLLPEIHSSGSCVTASDFDQDGDLDLFVGGRLVPGKYPASPQSYLLRNDGGQFTDVSNMLYKGGKLGMVTSALWTDINLDNLPDIIIVGEWMNVTPLINNGDYFEEESKTYHLDNTSGWWNSINGGDFDNDGDIDYIVGNYGLNSYYKASEKEPLEIYGKDFDHNGTFDPIITHYVDGKTYIVHTKNVITELIPSIQNRFSTFESYGNASFNESFTSQELEGAIHLNSKMMQSVILQRTEENEFVIHNLPIEVQFSPVFGIQLEDFNGDNRLDVMLVGNSMADESFTGYYDASYGNILINKGEFKWDVLSPHNSNFITDGDKKALVSLNIGNQPMFLVSENNGFLQAFAFEPLELSTFLPNDDDWYFMLNSGGLKRKVELYYGSGFLSSSSRKLSIPKSLEHLKFTNYMGETKTEFIK